MTITAEITGRYWSNYKCGLRMSDSRGEKKEKKNNTGRTERQRLKYSQILSKKLENNKSTLLKKKLNACIKRAVTGTVNHLYGNKRVKRMNHVKRKSWWNGTLGKLRNMRAKVSRTILEASRTLIREIKLGIYRSYFQ